MNTTAPSIAIEIYSLFTSNKLKDILFNLGAIFNLLYQNTLFYIKIQFFAF